MDQKRVEEIYRQIEGLHIELDPDPTVLGPRYIIERVAKCRNHLNIVSQIRQSISKERREVKRLLSAEEALFSIERDHLLASNDTVKKQPNIRDREALTGMMLRERLERIAQLKADLLDLDTVEQPVKMVHEELVRTSGEIRTQRSMIQADRTSGSGYGDEGSPVDEKGRTLPEEDGLDEAELDRIMREETPLVATRVAPPEPSPQTPPVAEEVPSVEPIPDPEPTPEPTPAEAQKSNGIDLHQEVPLSKLKLPEGATSEAAKDAYAKAFEEPAPQPVTGEDPDIAKFLESGDSVPTVVAKTPKKPKSDPTPPPSNSGDIDFADLLSNL